MNRYKKRATAQYTYGRVGKVIWLEDLGKEGTRSLTNDMENVLNDLINETGDDLTQYKVVYKDSQGNWDGVRPHFNREATEVISIGWYPLRTRDKETAIRNAI